MVTLKLINKGPEIHHIQLIRLNDGKTFGDFTAALKALKPGAPLPTFVEELAAPNVPAGAEGQEVTQELTAGNYVLACMIPSPDGIPHFAKGMMRPLTVVASTGLTASVPMADVRVTMTDYASGCRRCGCLGSCCNRWLKLALAARDERWIPGAASDRSGRQRAITCLPSSGSAKKTVVARAMTAVCSVRQFWSSRGR